MAPVPADTKHSTTTTTTTSTSSSSGVERCRKLQSMEDNPDLTLVHQGADGRPWWAVQKRFWHTRRTIIQDCPTWFWTHHENHQTLETLVEEAALAGHQLQGLCPCSE